MKKFIFLFITISFSIYAVDIIMSKNGKKLECKVEKYAKGKVYIKIGQNSKSISINKICSIDFNVEKTDKKKAEEKTIAREPNSNKNLKDILDNFERYIGEVIEAKIYLRLNIIPNEKEKNISETLLTGNKFANIVVFFDNKAIPFVKKITYRDYKERKRRMLLPTEEDYLDETPKMFTFYGIAEEVNDPKESTKKIKILRLIGNHQEPYKGMKRYYSWL